MSEESIEVDKKGSWKGLLETMRPHQWVKNLFVLAPLFFAQAFWEINLVFKALGATLLFCAMAGTVYIINDLVDLERDRHHPLKRHRPLPSGRLPAAMARRAAWVLGVSTLGLALALEPWLAGALSIYLVMNLAYSRVLKEWAFVDVMVIAIGFLLRVIAGSLAVGVFLSEWLLVCTFLLASFLGLGKRRHELALYQAGTVKKTRKVLERYRMESLDLTLFSVGGLTIAAYTIYTLTAALPDQPLRRQDTPFDSPFLPLTIPFVVLGLARFFQLAQSEMALSPTEALLKDRLVLGSVFCWLATLAVLVVTL